MQLKLPARDTKNHKSCICLRLHCWGLKSSAPEDAKSHWSHLFDFFPLCAFKYVLKSVWNFKWALNCLPETIQSHIYCICLTFLPCVFLNVSLNRLSEMMHSCTFLFFLILSTVRFQMCPLIKCLIWWKVTLIVFVCLFPTVCFHMCPQAAFMNEYKVTLVAFVGTFLQCVFSRVSSNCLSEKTFSHIGCIFIGPMCTCFEEERMLKSTGWVILSFY